MTYVGAVNSSRQENDSSSSSSSSSASSSSSSSSSSEEDTSSDEKEDTDGDEEDVDEEDEAVKAVKAAKDAEGFAAVSHWVVMTSGEEPVKMSVNDMRSGMNDGTLLPSTFACVFGGTEWVAITDVS